MGFAFFCQKVSTVPDTKLTWNDFIIDGHNRYGLHTKLGIPFRTEAREFESRNDVCIWMIQNQLARRNVDNWIKINLGFRMEDYIVAKGKENLKLGGRPKSNENGFLISGNLSEKKSVKPVHAERELAKLAGVGHDTIYKPKEIKTKAPTEILPELERKIISHTVSINQAHKFFKAIHAFKSAVMDQVTVARKILNAFDKNPSVSLEIKPKT